MEGAAPSAPLFFSRGIPLTLHADAESDRQSSLDSRCARISSAAGSTTVIAVAVAPLGIGYPHELAPEITVSSRRAPGSGENEPGTVFHILPTLEQRPHPGHGSLLESVVCYHLPGLQFFQGLP